MKDWLLRSEENSKYVLKNVGIADTGAATSPRAEIEQQEAQPRLR